MPRDWTQFLDDMVKATQRALEYCGGYTARALQKDVMRLTAITHEIQTIGEAAKRIPNEICQLAPSIPWKDIRGVRDMLVHDYFDIRNDIVIDVCLTELPALLAELLQLQKALEPK
ncbi:MAG: DUF86 domain-containing protein [Chlamydiia bacterium]